MTDYVAYYRVSTDRQGRSGLGLDAQRHAIESFARARTRDRSVIAEFTEVMSGARNDRPALAAALDLCKRKRATLVVAKLDRLARNVAFISRLMESSVEFVAVDNPHANRLTVHLLAAIAEHERELISTRTREAMAAAKARGARFGWADPRRQSQVRSAASSSGAIQEARADTRAQLIAPILHEIKSRGAVSYRAIARELNTRGFKPAKGAMWHARTVIDLERRLTRTMLPIAPVGIL